MLTRSSRVARTALIGLLAFLLAVVPLQSFAQDRTSRLSDGGNVGVGTETFVIPPTGYIVQYFFTGAATVINEIATSVHCTNIGGPATAMRFEFYDYGGNLVGVGTWAGLAQHTTITVSAPNSTALYDEDVTVSLTSDLNQGVVRVLKKGTGKIICTAYVLDSRGGKPSFVYPLPNFGPTGLF